MRPRDFWWLVVGMLFAITLVYLGGCLDQETLAKERRCPTEDSCQPQYVNHHWQIVKVTP